MAERTDSGFYVTGGTLRPDAACYVERQADKDLLDGLLKGEFCYVLTSRQMGKSSLMVRTANKLREQGVSVVVLDLTAIGQNLTPEQWYDGLVARMGRQLRWEDELEEFWESHPKLGPCQRFFAAIREVVMGSARVPRAVFGVPPNTSGSNESTATSQPREPRIPPGETPGGATGTVALPSTLDPRPSTGRLVIFVDELDVVRSLPFSTDEFFAAIRECYNRRTEDPEFNRLTFCLLGVATPSDLIRDTRTTPFNIGRRIELNDFRPQEAAPLAKGLCNSEPGTRNSELLLDRILYWTNGHPYLTQRLCQAVTECSSRREEVSSEKSEIRNQKSGISQNFLTSAATGLIDELCEELFFSPRAREQDDNLLFVRERLLRSEADVAGLLHVYEGVRAQKRVRDDEANPLIALLRLSGVARVVEGYLSVRNRIYFRVFDRQWVRANMPDAEVRRQRAAFRRGVVRAATVAAMLVSVMTVLMLFAVQQANRANRLAKEESRQRRSAEQQLYVSDMNVAQQAWEAGNLARAQELLERQRPGPGREDLRSFEWRYLWRLSQSDELFTFRGHTGPVYGVAISPKGDLLATASQDNTVRLWDVVLRQEIAVLRDHSEAVLCVAFSPTASLLATGGQDQSIILWDMTTRKKLAAIRGHSDWVESLAFSPDGKTLASGGRDRVIKLWNVEMRLETATLAGHTGRVASLAFSLDGTLLASGSRDGTVKLWDAANRRELATLDGHQKFVWSVAFSPDGKTVAAGSDDGAVLLWDVISRQEMRGLSGHKSVVTSVVFSPDGHTLVTASLDNTVKLWDAKSKEEIGTLRGHLASVHQVAFSPDGRTLITGSFDATVKLWSNSPSKAVATLNGHTGSSWVTFSPDGKMLASAGTDGLIRLWDSMSQVELFTLKGHTDRVNAVSLSRDGNALASVSNDQTAKVWSIATRREQARLIGHTRLLNRGWFLSGARRLITGGYDRTIKLWDIPSQQEITSLTLSGEIWSLTVSRNGDTFAAGCVNGDITVGDVLSLRPMLSIRAHNISVRDLAFSPDGKTLATGSWDGTAKLWNLATQKAEILRVPPVNTMAFSPDGKTLAIGSADKTIRFYNVATRQEVLALQAHSTGVNRVEFSPDGKLLASGGVDGTIKLWHAATFAQTDSPPQRQKQQ